MDSQQGAGFAFNMNMDFSNVFATTKPNEGETSFFFGDEGIDTTASFVDPIMFPQTAFDMQHNLSMDNTAGSTSAWNGQLTPQSQNALNSFPPTPMQSFDSIYQPNFSTLGKRSLQLDVQDFPQSKRHESMADLTTASMFSPLPGSTTASSWPLDAQHTPATSVEFGISDEAADMCAMWFNKYAILPSDKHIDSLSQLTGESVEAIRHWFGRLMKQGMGGAHGDSAYKSQTTLPQAQQFWNEYPTDLVSVPQLPLEESTQESVTASEITPHITTVSQPATSLRNGKKTRCTPTDDQSLLSRDSNKIYQCTRKCGKRYGRKCDWKRNEEEGYPCKSWVCSLCTSEGVDNVKPCFRKYHFAQHFRNIHPGLNCDDYEESSVVCSETEFPRKCGFCKHHFKSRQERIDHIADHFKQGKCMLDWNDSEDSHDADDNDDNDDRPNDDGSDGGAPSYPPPPSDPQGGPDSKYYGGGGYSDGSDSSSGGAQGGFFHFQLSQLHEGENGRQSSCADQHIKPTGALQHPQQRTRYASEPLHQRSTEPFSLAATPSVHGKLDAPKGDHPNALARDVISGHLAKQERVNVPREERHRVSNDRQPTGASILDVKTDWLDALLRSRQPMTVSKAAVSSQPTGVAHDHQIVEGSLCVSETAKATSAEPAFIEEMQIDQTTSTLIDGANIFRTLPTNLPSTKKKTALTSGALPSEPKVLQSISTTSQSFLSVRYLGSGGFSTVDEVVHRGTNLHLSRKTLKNRDPAALKELWKEVNVLQKLRHPHVIRFLGAYSKGDKMSMLLSPIADATLALWLDRFVKEKPANLSQVITKMFGCLASSVRYLHEQRPVVKHMDIKPQNILIVEGDGEFPHVVLCDFGISSSEEDVLDGRISQPLTRQYIAPEAFEGFTRKQAADIWSLGCVFAEMASVSFSHDNSQWSDLRKEFSGRSGKYYWQDVPRLQDRLSMLLEASATSTETTIVRTLKSMLNAQPAERPDAASLTLVFTPAPCCLSWPHDKASYPGPHEELSSVEMLLHEEGIDCRAQLHAQGDLNTESRQGISSAKSWLEQCSHCHEACSQVVPDDTNTLPTRLLDLQPDGDQGGAVRVIDSASIESSTGRVEYIALSHAWTQSDVTLSTDSLQDKHVDIPLSKLSHMLKSAITTAQDLGYRYIWTDSLCVIQDSEDSKQVECANMASVFRNAVLTLILDSLDDGLEAFKNKLAESQSGFAWDTRAWSLQERLLSHRFLHLGQEQMYWECNSLKASETFPRGLPSLIWEKAHTKLEVREGLQPHLTGRLASTNVKATGPAEHAQANSPQHRRILNCQWIKKDGDDIGDSMEAAQTTLQIESATASTEAVAYGHDGHELTNKRELLRIRELGATGLSQYGSFKSTPMSRETCDNPFPGVQTYGKLTQHFKTKCSAFNDQHVSSGVCTSSTCNGKHAACGICTTWICYDTSTRDAAAVPTQSSSAGLSIPARHKPSSDDQAIDAPRPETHVSSTNADIKLARKEIESSGQLDQHGNLECLNDNRNRIVRITMDDDDEMVDNDKAVGRKE